MKDSTRQGIVGWGILAGVLMMVCGVGATWMFSVGGVYRGTYTRTPGTNQITDAGTLNLVPLCILFIATGLSLSLGCLIYGTYTVKNQNKGARTVHEYAKVIARFGVNKRGEMVTDMWDFDDVTDLRFYVKLSIPNVPEVREYECDQPVFDAACEGMSGQATVQGRWLGQFVQYRYDPGNFNDYKP